MGGFLSFKGRSKGRARIDWGDHDAVQDAPVMIDLVAEPATPLLAQENALLDIASPPLAEANGLLDAPAVGQTAIVPASWLTYEIEKTKKVTDDGQGLVVVRSPWDDARGRAVAALREVAASRPVASSASTALVPVKPAPVPALPQAFVPKAAPALQTVRDGVSAAKPEAMMMVRLAVVGGLAIAATFGAKAMSEANSEYRATRNAEIAERAELTRAYNQQIRLEQQRAKRFNKAYVKYHGI